MMHTIASRFMHGGDIDLALGVARDLVRQLLIDARPLGLASELADLGGIDLPPIVGSPADQAHVRSAAPMYLASELEIAGLLSAVEQLASLAAGGGLAADLGPVADRLAHFWRSRNERFAPEERRAFFARLFGNQTDAPGLSLPAGGSRNSEFESLLVDVCETLYRFEQPVLLVGAAPPSDGTLRVSAQQLAANLAARSGGLTTYAADDILHAVQAALEILKERSVQQAFGARTVWGVVRALKSGHGGAMYSSAEPQTDADITAHLARGKNGMLILNWLADALPGLQDSGTRLLVGGEPVIAAASAWLQASLTLADAQESARKRAEPVGAR